MTLTEFLSARIAEDEASIRADLVGREWPNPRRARAECVAKRRIIGDPHTRGGTMYDYFLLVLAAVYADHPDYRPEWAIDNPTQPSKQRKA